MAACLAGCLSGWLNGMFCGWFGGCLVHLLGALLMVWLGVRLVVPQLPLNKSIFFPFVYPLFSLQHFTIIPVTEKPLRLLQQQEK